MKQPLGRAPVGPQQAVLARPHLRLSRYSMNDEEKADSLKAATKKFRNTWFGKNSMNMKRFMPLIPTADTDEDDDEDDDDDDDDDDDEIDDDDDEEYDEEDDDDDDADDDDDDEVEEDNSDSDEEEVLEVPVSPVKVTKKKSLFTPDKKNGKKASKTKKDTKKVPSPSKKDNAPKESKREVSSVADVHFFTKKPLPLHGLLENQGTIDGKRRRSVCSAFPRFAGRFEPIVGK